MITPSFAPDFELCADLHRSVLDHAPDCAHHHIIVPREDIKLFSRLAGPRTHVHCEADFLPRGFVSIPFSKFTINLRRPVPPVRGWILQQLVKLAAAAASQADVVVLVDSDIVFIRPFTAETFVKDGRVRFYRKAGGVDERLPRHMIWHSVARSMLGLPPAEPPYPDYIASLLAWDPAIVRQMLARVETATGRPWATAVAGQLHFSEWTLYGVFVDNVLSAAANSSASDDPLCLADWSTSPLTRETADKLLCRLKRTDIAVMISAKSRTPLEVRRTALAARRAALTADVPLRRVV
ncbi:DUF6492 family protein [Mesorhizobium sp. BAC0120]|uniref:DUF6492 family protein n=1 Tax=Mesorhizobium sp. BAC0120 TaxID=3090670 RepID=UPI00298BE6E2|nr:DUF6492 family protein [Mesorhizobium sp. BAC0120]MDW6021571.1 DUF6492 family protein [Mesorhizobium sp. BAC0120]